MAESSMAPVHKQYQKLNFLQTKKKYFDTV
jgi:hypothetical protein